MSFFNFLGMNQLISKSLHVEYLIIKNMIRRDMANIIIGCRYNNLILKFGSAS